jgi:hypothetical protein
MPRRSSELPQELSVVTLKVKKGPTGIQPLPHWPEVIVTNEVIDRLREDAEI